MVIGSAALTLKCSVWEQNFYHGEWRYYMAFAAVHVNMDIETGTSHVHKMPSVQILSFCGAWLQMPWIQ